MTQIIACKLGETYPSVYYEAGESDYPGVRLQKSGYTDFWGGRAGYAVADGWLDADEAERLAKAAGFTHFGRFVTQ